jgi:hypothetical protein
LWLVASPSPVTAAVTLGQLSPKTPADIDCSVADFAQLSVTSGNSYVVPGNGTITSWSTNASAPAGQTYAMKVFRKVADPARYAVVGHDSRPLAGGTVNTFSASIPVKPGDLLGSSSDTGINSACVYSTPLGDIWLTRPNNLADGESGDFSIGMGARVNVSAVFVPTNTFTLGATTHDKKKGTATLTLNLPNPGNLRGSGNGVRVAGAAAISKAVGAGPAQLLIKAKGRKKRQLNQTGKVKLKVAVTYTPTGGDPGTRSLKVKLKKL